MTEGARKLSTQRLTIRVPWHDLAWVGSFCRDCRGNTSCTVLPRIGTGRDDAFEVALCFFESAQLTAGCDTPWIAHLATGKTGEVAARLSRARRVRRGQGLHAHVRSARLQCLVPGGRGALARYQSGPSVVDR